jgi:hypothetical protein
VRLPALQRCQALACADDPPSGYAPGSTQLLQCMCCPEYEVRPCATLCPRLSVFQRGAVLTCQHCAAQADPSDPAYASGDLDSPARRSTGHASSRSLDPADLGQLSSQRSLGGMLSLPTFKAQRRQPSAELGSEVNCVARCWCQGEQLWDLNVHMAAEY